MAWWKKVVYIYHNVFNAKFAIISAVCNGLIAMVVNGAYGPKEYLMAGLAQGASSFLSTGITARVVQHFSPIKSALPSYFFGSLVPASLTFVMSLLVHLWNNTPEVLASCVAPTVISYTTSYITNYLTRHGRMLPGNYGGQK
ncbi:MAG: hypothetical protein WCV92_01810 [Candidatus Buchananbacteria bacterium]